MAWKVIIIDDNPLEIEYLKSNIDWEALDFNICAQALNAKRGLFYYEKHQPDLIITDIQMPGNSGIDMINDIRKRDDKVCVVFLSSYEIFEYAKSGYDLGVIQYILKQDIGTDKVQKQLEYVKNYLEEKKQMEQWRKNNKAAENSMLITDRKYSRDVQNILQFIAENYASLDLSIEKIANYLNLSSTRTRSIFREETGISIGQYIQDVRMEKAKELLKRYRYKSDEIAEAIGYLDGKYFRRRFKQKYGITPHEYREGKEIQNKG